MVQHEILKFGDRNRSIAPVGKVSLTQQNMANETDVNNIMAKYQKTQILTHVSRYAGEYGDFSGVPDYHEAMQRLIAADEMFMSLPAKIRDRFNNDPAQFIEFATDKENLPELRKMGLAPEAPMPPEPQLVKVVAEPETDERPAPKKPGKGDQ